MIESVIPAECDYPSTYTCVDGGHRLHYIQDGQGLPLLFVHGIPTYSYTWRNILPHLSAHSHCIALDMLGFGLSDKPDIQYDLATYQTTFAQFIDNLKLEQIILVLHGFGSVIGLDYAMKHPEKIKGLVFMESHLRQTTDLNDISLPVHEMIMLNQNYTAEELEEKVLQENFYVEKILPASILRSLSKKEMDFYRKPFPTPASRKAILDFIKLTPYLHENQDVADCINTYSNKLMQSHIPKLMLYALPGFVSTMSTVHWAKEKLPNTRLVDIGEALHIPQETQPVAIGQAIQDWINTEF